MAGFEACVYDVSKDAACLHESSGFSDISAARFCKRFFKIIHSSIVVGKFEKVNTEKIVRYIMKGSLFESFFKFP